MFLGRADQIFPGVGPTNLCRSRNQKTFAKDWSSRAVLGPPISYPRTNFLFEVRFRAKTELKRQIRLDLLQHQRSREVRIRIHGISAHPNLEVKVRCRRVARIA
jgi:hypothetical protein